jgi:hypothetical protein
VATKNKCVRKSSITLKNYTKQTPDVSNFYNWWLLIAASTLIRFGKGRGKGKGSVTLSLSTFGQALLERFNFVVVHFHVRWVGGTDPKQQKLAKTLNKLAYPSKNFLIVFFSCAGTFNDLANSSKYCKVMQLAAYEAISSF